MKKGKIIEIVVVIICAVYMVYMLITGQAGLAIEGQIILFVVLPICLLVGIINIIRSKVHQKSAQNTATGETAGSVPTPMGIFWFMVIFMIILWVLIGGMTVLSFQLGAFEEDSSAVAPLAAVWGILIALTLFTAFIVVKFGKSIYYNSQGVTLRGFGLQKVFSWKEIQEVRSVGVFMVFCGSSGKKLFKVNINSPGYKKLWEFYQNKKG